MLQEFTALVTKALAIVCGPAGFFQLVLQLAQSGCGDSPGIDLTATGDQMVAVLSKGPGLQMGPTDR